VPHGGLLQLDEAVLALALRGRVGHLGLTQIRDRLALGEGGLGELEDRRFAHELLDGGVLKPILLSLLLAAVFGAVTPFCSCSSIPLFIGFVGAGIPLAVTLTFLISSPLVNEVAVVLLAQTFGIGNTVAYVVAGLSAAVIIGFVLSRFKLDHLVADFVFATPVAALQIDGRKPTLQERVDAAREETADIFGRVWKWVILGVGNDVLACAYRLTRADMSALRKRGLRRFSRHTSAYRLVLPVSEATHAAAVAASVLRDVFSVIHPAFLKGGGFSVGGQPRSE